MMHELRTRRRIEFSDTDLAGIVHFSRFFVFMETAEHQFLNALGTSVHAIVDGRRVGWPRLEASCEFLRSVRFEDELDIVLRVARKGTKSMTYTVEFLHRGEAVARGRIASVCCVLEEGEPPRSIPIPEELASRIEEAPATAEAS
jgi:YbgC/YbaW family acyl-CoA thioester hydrolase